MFEEGNGLFFEEKVGCFVGSKASVLGRKWAVWRRSGLF